MISKQLDLLFGLIIVCLQFLEEFLRI